MTNARELTNRLADLLRKEHGATFDQYCEAVPRFVPRFAGFHTPEVIEVKVKALRSITSFLFDPTTSV